MINLFVDCFHGELRGMNARHAVLNGCPDNAAYENDRKYPHHHPRERSPKMEGAMQEDQRIRKQSEPEMRAHPGLRSANPPHRKLLAQAEQSRKDHEAEPNAAVDQPHRTASAP